MKYRIVFIIILFPVCAAGQTKTSLDSLSRIVLNDLTDSWTLGVDSTADAVDIRTYNKFKNLFDLNATVNDDFNALFQYRNKKSGSYKTDNKPKAFDVYAHDVALQVKSMIIDSIVTSDPNITNKKNITFTIKRRVSFQKVRKFVLPDDYPAKVISSRQIEFNDKNDSLKMVSDLNAKVSANQEAVYKFISSESLQVTMAFEMDTVRITSIKSVINELRCTNDADLDAVLDQEDELKNKFGDFTTQGRPDYDLDGIADEQDKCATTYGYLANKGCPPSYFFTKNELDGFIGWQIHSAKINLPELNQLGYLDQSGKDAMDVLQSKKGILKNSGTPAGAYAGGNYTYYFGKKRKRTGISVGLTYSTFTVDYELTSPIVYTFKSNDGKDNYRRQITINSLKEDMSYSIFNFPLLFNYRLHFDKKNRSVLNLKAGPSLMLFNNTSTYNAVISFEGLYQVDTILKNKITYYDHFDQSSAYNVFFKADSINTQNPDPGANNVFDRLRSKTYDFADNKNYNGKQNLRHLAVALNLDLTLQHKLSERLTIEVGTHLVYVPLMTKRERYKPIDSTTDQYQSIYNSNAKSQYYSFGLNIGSVYSF